MRQRLPSPFDPARRRGLAAAAVATLCVLGATAQAASPSVVPLDVDVSVPPAAIRSGEMRHFLYEMRLSNFASREIALAQLDVVADDGRLLARFAASDLAGMLAVPGQAAGTPTGQARAGELRNAVHLSAGARGRRTAARTLPPPEYRGRRRTPIRAASSSMGHAWPSRRRVRLRCWGRR
ncbi:hypothetical protein [Pseudoxanthomonas mexicana]